MLVQIFLETSDAFKNNKTKSISSGIVKHVCKLMEEAIEEENITIKYFANKAGVFEHRLFSLFKKETGLTPADYFSRLRCTKARTALLDSEEDITRIAFRFGFSSSQYFATIFKKYTGLSPSGYRKKYQAAVQ